MWLLDKEKKDIEATVDKTVDKKKARVSAKFKEVEIKSANAGQRKGKHKSA